jgi:hypothetical protein
MLVERLQCLGHKLKQLERLDKKQVVRKTLEQVLD